MSKKVQILPDDVRSAASGISGQVEALESVLSEVKTAHGKLLLDDIFSLENYSYKVHLGLLKADGDLAKIKRKLEECAKKASSAADGMEQIDNGEGKVAADSGGKKLNNWLAWIATGFLGTTPVVLVPLVISIFGRNSGGGTSTSSDAYVLAEWNGKETVEKKSDEFHQYYEELEAEHAEWVKQHTPEVRLTDHMNRSKKQGDYSAFTKPYGSNAGCCATAYATGLSIVTGKDYDPTQFWDTSVGTTYYSEGHVRANLPYDAGTIYEGLKNGKPTMLNYTYSGGGQHWVLITGTRSGAEGFDPNNITVADFIALDPANGKEVPLTEVTRFEGATIQKMNTFF